MKKSIAASLFAASFLALCTGAAFAGNGHGGGHDHDSGGQVQGQSHDANGGGGGWGHDRSQPQSQPQPQQQEQQHGGGWSKHESDGSVQSGGSNDRGVKPDSTTKHDTYARADSDKTKRYGNGKTAGKIATSRGASGDTVLHGPGNSQPHKVVSCGHRHEVDVHAVKSYSSASCGEQKHAVAAASHERKHEVKHERKHEQKAAETCAKTVTVTVPAGVWHDAGSRWVRSGSKHAGDVEVAQSTTRTITIADACKRSESQVQAAAFRQAVPKCGHRVESVVKVREQKPKPAAAVAPAAVEQKKVYICHATGSSTNPYVLIHVSKHAEWAHTRHHEGRDVVLGETLTGSCPSAPPAAAAVAPAQAQSCTTQQQVQVVVGVKHFIGPKGSGRYVIIHPSPSSSHFANKHPDELIYETRTVTVAAPCPTSTTPAAVQQATTTTTAAVVQTETVAPPAQTTAAPAAPAPAAGGVLPAQTAQSAPAETTPAQGGVLGAQATIAPKAKPANGGVLGTTGRIASSRLPFTGIELWIFAVVAAALIAAGATLRRSGRGTL
jgi:hypothetical protein